MVCLLIGLRKIAPVAPFLRGSTHEHGFVRMTGLRSDTLGSNGWTRRQRRMLKPSSQRWARKSHVRMTSPTATSYRSTVKPQRWNRIRQRLRFC